MKEMKTSEPRSSYSAPPELNAALELFCQLTAESTSQTAYDEAQAMSREPGPRYKS